MKKIKNITRLALAFVLTITFSCKDEFLEQAPLSTLSPENTFIDATGLQTALDAALKGVFNQWNGDNREILFNHNMSEATVVSATDKPDAFVDMRTYATPQNSRNNDAARARSFYEGDYVNIKSCNTVIEYIDIPDWDGGVNNPDRNHLLGSAYFLRAFFYMQLTMQFGNVAFPLNLIAEARQDFKVFHMQGIWDQMIADLEYAVQHVKPKSELPIGQAPKDAVKILLAKYYMLNERFADAERLMDEVINDPESRLFTDADVNVDIVRVGNNLNPFTGEELDGFDCNQPADAINLLHMDAGAQKTSNPEGIWLMVNEPFIDGSQGRSASLRAWGPNFVSTNKGVKAPPAGTVTGMDIAQNERSKQMHKWGRGQGFARPTNYSQFEIWKFKGENDTQDYRHKRGNWFDMDMLIYDNPDLQGTEWYGKPARLYEDGVLLCEDSIRCWYGYPMYKFYAENLEDQVKRQDGGKRDIYILREAEAYLLRAEARFWQGNSAGAADDINVIRQRANAIHMYTAGDVQAEGIGAILDERCRELYGEEYRHDELVRISIIFAKTGKTAYNGNTYSWDGQDMEKSLSQNNFYYDRQMERNNFYKNNVPWSTYPETKYTLDKYHIFWPVYEPYLIGNVGNILNQTTGYDGSERNVEPLVHVVQTPGLPNVDPMDAIGAR
ncbi:RagB/SusD family nutrient uptake outer membrane protein [Membranihabitans marinus]|uniref:RagB/SusD family nutrient uptake outer membrane protein n=1 Tax=Membranihabitans marinus TaxID=1227546 RepID=UPI001F43F37A|nr:RagB/SusD family nutrient uptake outer membrane protein [Membranihabitans marinus]